MDLFDRLNNSFKSILNLPTCGSGWWDILIFPLSFVALVHYHERIDTFVESSTVGNVALYIVIGVTGLLVLRSLYSSYVYIPYKGFRSFWYGIAEPVILLSGGLLILRVLSELYWVFFKNLDVPITETHSEQVTLLIIGIFLPRFCLSFFLAIGVFVTALVRGELFYYFSFRSIKQLLDKVREIYADPRSQSFNTPPKESSVTEETFIAQSYKLQEHQAPEQQTATLIDEIELAKDARIQREDRDVNDADFHNQFIKGKGRKSSKRIKDTDRPRLPRKFPRWRNPKDK